MDNAKKVMTLLLVIILLMGSTTHMVYADITTGLIGKYEFNEDIKNSVNGTSARVTAGDVTKDGQDREPIYTEGVDGSSILFNGEESDYGIELLDCKINDNSFTISYDVYYTKYTQYSPSVFMSEYFYESMEQPWKYVQFGQIETCSLAYAPSMYVYDYAYDIKQGTLGTITKITPQNPIENIVSDTGEYAWRAEWLKWTNITYVVNKDDINVYVDGEEIELKVEYNSENIYEVTNDVRIFLGACQMEEPVSAAFDNLYIYDRPLSQSDVQELILSRDYEKEFKLPEGVEVKLTKDYDKLWNLDGSANDTVVDDDKEDGVDDTVNQTSENVEDLYAKRNFDIMKKVVVASICVAVLLILCNALIRKRKVRSYEIPSGKYIKLKTVLDNVLSVKSFMIIIAITSIVVFIWIKYSSDNRQEKQNDIIKENMEYAKDYVGDYIENDEKDSRYGGSNIKDIIKLDMPSKGYCDMEKTTALSKVLEQGDLEPEGIKGVMLGVDIDGKGIERYYFTDKNIIEQIMDKIKNIEVTKLTNTNVGGYQVEEDFGIQLCRDNSEYGFTFTGMQTSDSACYMVTAQEAYNVGYYTIKYAQDQIYPYEQTLGGIYQFLFDSDIKEFIADIIKDNVEQLDAESMLEICLEDEIDLGRLFGYKHTPPTYVSSSLESGARAYEFKFPIKGTECYLLIKKQSFTMNFEPAYMLEKVEVHKGDKEYMDMTKATKREVENFIN